MAKKKRKKKTAGRKKKKALPASEPSVRIPSDFRGFRWQPGSEMEVVCLFGALLPHLDWPLALDEVRTKFPDCLATNTRTNEDVRIEFELYSSSFKQHGHPSAGCDYIVCWEDDYGGDLGGPEVIELSRIVAEKCPDLILEDQQKRPSQRWNLKSFREECEELSRRHHEIIGAVVAFAKAEGLGPKWVSGSYAAFAVGDVDQFFRIYATGYVGFPLFRWRRRHLFPELFDRLNAALAPCDADSAKRFNPGREAKKGGWDAAEILPEQEHLDRFFDVWRWLREQPVGG